MLRRADSGFRSNLRRTGIRYATGGAIRQVLEDCLFTEWNQHVLASGEDPTQNKLIATYSIQGCEFPAIFKGSPPDNIDVSRDGAELVVLPDPQIRKASQQFRVRRWTFLIVDRSPEQNRIEAIQNLLMNLFGSEVFYVPLPESTNSNLAYIQGFFQLDITNHLRDIREFNGQNGNGLLPPQPL